MKRRGWLKKSHWKSPYCSSNPSLYPRSHLNIREANLVEMTTDSRAHNSDPQYQDLANIPNCCFLIVLCLKNGIQKEESFQNLFQHLLWFITCLCLRIKSQLSGYVENLASKRFTGVKDWKRTNPYKVTVLFWACWVSNLFWSFVKSIISKYSTHTLLVWLNQ